MLRQVQLLSRHQAKLLLKKDMGADRRRINGICDKGYVHGPVAHIGISLTGVKGRYVEAALRMLLHKGTEHCGKHECQQAPYAGHIKVSGRR